VRPRRSRRHRALMIVTLSPMMSDSLRRRVKRFSEKSRDGLNLFSDKSRGGICQWLGIGRRVSPREATRLWSGCRSELKSPKTHPARESAPAGAFSGQSRDALVH
jgi:hypothetical protein